jgi:FtsP/CotA-like multicopper oxidase with cupredoxin domain
VKSLSGFAATALLCIALCQPAIAAQRVHYIAADEILWNYAPLHQNIVAGAPLPPLGKTQLGWLYRKAVYREYTGRDFAHLVTVPRSERYRGILGPTIYAEAGDTVVIVFKNRTRVPVDIAPSGLPSNPAPKPVPPSQTRTYRWSITPQLGPAEHDMSSIVYLYESNVDNESSILPNPDENAALIGPLIVTRRGDARADGSPMDVDRNIVMLFSLQQESLSPLFETNLRDSQVNPRRIDGKRIKREPDIVGDNGFGTINGYVFGNMPMPVIHTSERVRWYLLSTKNLLDFHAPTWDGQTVIWQGNRVDSVALTLPHAVADMVPDEPGVWLLSDSVNVMLLLGTEERYQVVP